MAQMDGWHDKETDGRLLGHKDYTLLTADARAVAGAGVVSRLTDETLKVLRRNLLSPKYWNEPHDWSSGTGFRGGIGGITGQCASIKFTIITGLDTGGYLWQTESSTAVQAALQRNLTSTA
jgi:hypothetical protein